MLSLYGVSPADDVRGRGDQRRDKRPGLQRRAVPRFSPAPEAQQNPPPPAQQGAPLQTLEPPLLAANITITITIFELKYLLSDQLDKLLLLEVKQKISVTVQQGGMLLIHQCNAFLNPASLNVGK